MYRRTFISTIELDSCIGIMSFYNNQLKIEPSTRKKSLIIFCKSGAEENFQVLFNMYTCKKKKNMLFPITSSVSMFKIENVPTMTNLGFLSFIGDYKTSDIIENKTVFYFIPSSNEDYKIVKQIIENIELINPKITLFIPFSLEHEILINDIFKKKNFAVKNIDKYNCNHLGSFENPNDLCMIYRPTGVHNVSIFENDKGKSIDSIIPRDDKGKNFSFFKKLPIVNFSLFKRFDSNCFDPKNEILSILVTTLIGNQMFYQSFIQNHSLVTQKIETNSDNNACIEFFETEQNLIEHFAEKFISNEFFSCLNNGISLYWLVDSRKDLELFMQFLIERSLWLKIGEKLVPHVDFSKNVIFGKHSLIYFFETEKHSIEKINCTDYLNCVLDDLNSSKVQKKIMLDEFCVNYSMMLSKLDLRHDKIENYKLFDNKNDNVELNLLTPFGLIKKMKIIAKIKIDEFIEKNHLSFIFNLSTQLCTSVLNVGFLNSYEKSELLLFISYLSKGIFFLPMKQKKFLTLNNTLTCEIKLPETCIGGYNFSKPGVYENVFHVDFHLFYSSIIMAFELSFNTVDVVSEHFLKLLMDKFPELFSETIKIKYEENTNDNNLIIVFLSNNFNRLFFEKWKVHLFGVNTMLKNFETDIASHRNLMKKILNSLIGNIGSQSFSYFSKQFYITVVALGRKIIQFVVSNIDLFESLNIAELVQKFYSEYNTTIISENIINIDTDGFSFLSISSPKKLVENINFFFSQLTGNNHLNCVLKHTAELHIECRKKLSYSFFNQNWKKVFSSEEHSILESIRKNELGKKYNFTLSSKTKPIILAFLISTYQNAPKKNYLELYRNTSDEKFSLEDAQSFLQLLSDPLIVLEDKKKCMNLKTPFLDELLLRFCKKFK